jgi:two-component system, cell cycle sensor histidine kinase and response regulator CckA
MDYRIQDLVDIPGLQSLLDSLYVSSGIPSAIIGMQGQILIGAGWQDICTKFHRINQETAKDCIRSDVTIISGLSESKRQVQITCPRGLTDTATALIIEGHHLANVFTGQLFIRKPERELFRRQARRFGFDEIAYLEAFDRVPVITQKQLDEYLSFILHLTEMLAFQGLRQLRALETNKALEDSESRFRTILETTRDGFWIVDLSGKLLEVNAAYSDMSGYRRDELLEMSIPQIEAAESAEDVSAHISGILAGYGHAVFESIHRRKDGSLFDVEVSVQPISGENNHLFAFIRNITDRKQAESEKSQLQEQLLQSQKIDSLGRLAGGVAHDFNNMLTVIMGHASLALSQLTPAAPLYTRLQEIEQAANRSAELTRQLLAFARKQPISPKMLDLNETISGMLKMLKRLLGENIELAWLPNTHVWPVQMDPSQVDQILANLCVNARDAITWVGKITIETDNVTLDAAHKMVGADFVPGDYVMLAVTDSGCGMDGSTIKKIFEPFFTTKGPGEGTGLGLAMVYGIVKQNAGQINVYSEPAKGTTFRIYLPRCIREEIVQADQVENIQHGQGETVFLLEDEVTVLELTKSMLEGLGYQVLAASTPAEALAEAEANTGKIQLLITDVIMPGMNGRELAERFKAILPDTRFLFMSGYTANVIGSLGGIEEGIHFIQKPFSLKELAGKVRAALEVKGPL